MFWTCLLVNFTQIFHSQLVSFRKLNCSNKIYVKRTDTILALAMKPDIFVFLNDLFYSLNSQTYEQVWMRCPESLRSKQHAHTCSISQHAATLSYNYWLLVVSLSLICFICCSVAFKVLVTFEVTCLVSLYFSGWMNDVKNKWLDELMNLCPYLLLFLLFLWCLSFSFF